jgi:histidinol dehydrogenase
VIRVFEGEKAFLAERGDELLGAGDLGGEIRRRVESIVARVRAEGDPALVAFAKDLDGVELAEADLRVSAATIEGGASETPESLRAVLRNAAANIRRFHERQKESSWSFEHEDGTLLGQKITPLDTVGVYVPGGHAVYPSTVLMNVIPAQIAGVRRLVACTPPGTIEKAPALAYALELLGVQEVYRIGGAQAVAAMAYGTATVPRVDKIVGPGNAYVATAKKLLYGTVGIDSLAGPSEIVVLADATADPVYVAADLLSQAEHGSGDERAILVSTSKDLVKAVQEEIERQLSDLPRAPAVREVLEKHGAAVVVSDREGAVSVVDQIAPEHLEIMMEDADELAQRVRNAGAIFVGPSSPVPIGDFYAGPNHVLPTGGTARFASPLGVYDFIKRSSLVRYSRERLRQDREDIEAFARTEGFEAHARAVSVRFRQS